MTCRSVFRVRHLDGDDCFGHAKAAFGRLGYGGHREGIRFVHVAAIGQRRRQRGIGGVREKDELKDNLTKKNEMGDLFFYRWHHGRTCLLSSTLMALASFRRTALESKSF